jgi:hypothetical protein
MKQNIAFRNGLKHDIQKYSIILADCKQILSLDGFIKYIAAGISGPV